MNELNEQSAAALAPDVRSELSSGQSPNAAQTVNSVATTGMQQALGLFIRQAYMSNLNFAIESKHHQQMRESWRICKSEHDSVDAGKLKALGIQTDMFEPITEVKRQAAISQLKDIWNAPGDKLFTLSPTPVPTVPKYVTEDALKRMLGDFLRIARESGVPPSEEAARKFGEDRTAEIMNAEREYARDQIDILEKLVHDKLVEGDFIDEFTRFADYLTVMGTGILEGPIPVVEFVNEYANDSSPDAVKIKRVPKKKLKFRAINPLNVYPSRDQVGIEDGNVCIKVSYPAYQLWQYSHKAKGGDDDVADGHWFRDTIRDLLAKHPNGGVHLSTESDGEAENRELAEQSPWRSDGSCMLEGINFYGKVKGNLLIRVGLNKNYDGTAIDEDDYYEINALVIDDFVVYVRITDPCIGRTLSKAVFYDAIDSFYGVSIAQRMISCQRVLNNCLKAFVSNLSMTALPIYVVDGVERLIDKSPSALQMYAGKVIGLTSGVLGQNSDPVKVLNVTNNLDKILTIYKQFILRADDISGIPAYTYGSTANAGGAARTYAGLSMLTEAANRLMKVCINQIDRLVIRTNVKRICDYLILHDKDCPYHGDVNVNPSGVMSLILRENERQKVIQFMDMVTKNQLIIQTIGPVGIIELFRQVLHTYDIDNEDKIIPSKKDVEIQRIFANLRSMAQIDQIQAQANQMQMGGMEQPQPQAPQPDALLGSSQEPIEGVESQPNPGSANERRGAA